MTENAKKSAALQEARNAYTVITVYDIDAEQDTIADNEVGDNYLIEVDGYYFEVKNGQLDVDASDEKPAGYDEGAMDLETITDLPDDVKIYQKTLANS